MVVIVTAEFRFRSAAVDLEWELLNNTPGRAKSQRSAVLLYLCRAKPSKDKNLGVFAVSDYRPSDTPVRSRFGMQTSILQNRFKANAQAVDLLPEAIIFT